MSGSILISPGISNCNKNVNGVRGRFLPVRKSFSLACERNLKSCNKCRGNWILFHPVASILELDFTNEGETKKDESDKFLLYCFCYRYISYKKSGKNLDRYPMILMQNEIMKTILTIRCITLTFNILSNAYPILILHKLDFSLKWW